MRATSRDAEVPRLPHRSAAPSSSPSLDRCGRGLRGLFNAIAELRDRGVGFTSPQENLNPSAPRGRFAALSEFIPHAPVRPLLLESAVFLTRPGSPLPPSIPPFVDAARSFLTAASLHVLDASSPPGATGFRVLSHNDAAVMVSPVIRGLLGSSGRGDRWRTLGRQARDVITAEGWTRIAETAGGTAYSPPVVTLHPLVKTTVHVLERDGAPVHAEFDVALTGPGAVRIDVVGGVLPRQAAWRDVAAPALSAAGFDVDAVPYDGKDIHTDGRFWDTIHHVVARPPTERHEEWAMAHTVRRLLQAHHGDTGWTPHMKPAKSAHLPTDSPPDAHLGALLFEFAGYHGLSWQAFDPVLQQAGYSLGPSSRPWRSHERILRRGTP